MYNIDYHPIEESELEELVTDLWLPFARNIEEIDEYYSLKEEPLEIAFSYWNSQLDNQDSTILVASIKDMLIGFSAGVIVRTEPHFSRNIGFHITHIYTKENYRRSKVASRLLEKITDIAKSKNCDWISTSTHLENNGANSLFDKREYKKNQYTRFRMI